MPRVGFEPTISAGERPQTYALDRAVTGTGIYIIVFHFIIIIIIIIIISWCLGHLIVLKDSISKIWIFQSDSFRRIHYLLSIPSVEQNYEPN